MGCALRSNYFIRPTYIVYIFVISLFPSYVRFYRTVAPNSSLHSWVYSLWQKLDMRQRIEYESRIGMCFSGSEYASSHWSESANCMGLQLAECKLRVQVTVVEEMIMRGVGW